MNRYPTREGMPVPVREIELPPTQHERAEPSNIDNHHLLYTRKKFGQFILSQLTRDLDEYQHVMFRDQHEALHRRYEDMYLPTPRQMMDRVDQAYQNNELLRLGPAMHPVYAEITDEQYQIAKKEYGIMLHGTPKN